MKLTSIGDLNSLPADTFAALLREAESISNRYDDFVEHEEEEDHRAPGIHASEVYGCMRRTIYSMLGTPKKKNLPKNWRQRFMFGRLAHEMVQQDFHRLATASNGLISFRDEVKISPKYQDIAAELDIHSSCDGVFAFSHRPYEDPFLRVGLEIKTESPDQYAKLTAPKEDHVVQAHIYMRCLDLPLMYFMYINKGNQNNTPSIQPFLVQYDPAIWASVEARCRELIQIASTEQLPPREESILCEFCPYAHTCEPTWRRKERAGVHRQMRV